MFGSVKKVHLSLIVGVVGVLLAGGARAATNPASCVNDIDCVATPQCGGDVCPYDGAHPFTCQPAGTAAKGRDGWCTTDTDCKCYAQGARCVGAYCSFTKASDAPATGAAGSSGSAGSTGSGGSTGSAGSTGTAGTGTDAGTSTGSSGGGCNVGGNAGAGWLSVALLGLTAAFVRRRRA